ncbi:MAG: hypothetical protein U5K27_02665 [Desulfotignum sp.]|nr:hypothetical protein [Desulfotignum sp.]
MYFEAIHTRMKTFTHGSMAIYALECAGGINAAADAPSSRNTNIANYSKERNSLQRPDEINASSGPERHHEPGYH